MQFQNQFVLAGQVIEKRTAAKDGKVWGHFIAVASIGQKVECRVPEAEYNRVETGMNVAVTGRLEQRGYNLNAIGEQVKLLNSNGNGTKAA